MNTQKKLVVTFSISLCLLLASIALSYYLSNLRSDAYKDSEHQKKSYSVDISMKVAGENLIKLALDNSLWDDMAKFANNKLPGWEVDNINTLLTTSNIQYIWVFDSKQELTYKIQDSTVESIAYPLPPVAFIKILDTEANQQKRSCQFYLKVGNKILDVTGATIHNSTDPSRKEKPSGYIFMAKLLDKQTLDNLEIVTNSKVKLNLDGNDNTEISSFNTVVTKTLFDWQEKNIGSLNFISEDTFAKKEADYSKYSLLVYLFVMVSIAIVVSIIIKKHVSGPLQKIEKTFNGGDINELAELLTKKDEFGQIALLIQKSFEQKKEIENSNLLLKDSKKEIESQYKKIEDTNKLLQDLNATKDKFFSIIAHDLRNPFGVILATTEFISNPNYDLTREEIVDFSKDINDTAKVLFNLLENLLTWARSQKGAIQFEPIKLEIEDLAATTKFLLAPQAEAKGIRIDLDMPRGLKVIADKNMITTVLRNLVANAIKFTKEGGEIKVCAKIRNNFVEVEVKDSGIGMSEAMQRKLFRIDENCTTLGTNQEKGTGLGLILCKEFVEKHGGSIWVHSELGKGSSFKFLLPQTDEILAENIPAVSE